MPTTIDSMTGVEIKSPFFDTAVSLELFPVHPNVLKNPNAPQKNRVALIYGSNGSGKSTISFIQMPKVVEFGGIGSFLLHYVEDKPHENTEEGEVEVKTNGPE